ncbi:hypothetical protein GGF46_000771 [Coemansia sp. RSA 552]|nr:hypothetical protein GGF46_000771 [Coemansia sp. RSA 552]
MAHQKEIAAFFSHHDVTVNTTKPSELTPAMLRDKTRHLAIKKTGSLGRSDSVQPNKLKNSVWHQRSQDSSRASSSSSSSVYGGDHAPAPTRDLAAEADMQQQQQQEPMPDTQTEDTQPHPAPGPAATAPALASPLAQDAAPHTLDPAAPHTLDPAAQTTNGDGNVTRSKHEQAVEQQQPGAAGAVPAVSPMQAPPTPRSFVDQHNMASPPALRSPVTDEFQQADSPVYRNFEPDSHRPEISPTIAENFVQMDSPAMDSSIRRASAISSPGGNGGGGAGSASPTATVGHGAVSPPRRHGSIRTRNNSVNSTRQNRVSAVMSPTHPEVALMLEQVKAHRKDVADLAQSSGILGDEYFKCLRGYTSIQEPDKAFWKRRYFAVAQRTLFLYTNECSRTPSDCLPMAEIAEPPRDAEDEVLMPNSIAINFGPAGEYYLYFDTADMRQAFEGEVQKAMAA